MLFADDPTQWALPRTIVPPEYPKALLEGRIGAHVDVLVSIDVKGNVVDASIVKAMPMSPDFEKSVLDVVRLWRFYRTIGVDCKPVATSGNVRVWFEPEGPKGKISGSGRASAASPRAAEASPRRALLRDRNASYARIRYPENGRFAGVQADIFLIARVNAAKGTVVSTEVVASDFQGAADGPLRARFEYNAKSAVSAWEFVESSGPDYKVCVPVAFVLR